MLWIGIAIIGLLAGRYLPTWVVLALPGLIIGLGFVATASTSAGSQRGLALYVAVLVAALTGVAEAVGRLTRRRRASRS